MITSLTLPSIPASFITFASRDAYVSTFIVVYAARPASRTSKPSRSTTFFPLTMMLPFYFIHILLCTGCNFWLVHYLDSGNLAGCTSIYDDLKLHELYIPRHFLSTCASLLKTNKQQPKVKFGGYVFFEVNRETIRWGGCFLYSKKQVQKEGRCAK